GSVRQDVPGAVGLAVVGAALVALGVTNSYTDVPDPAPAGSPWFLLPLAVVCGAALLTRRRPLTAVVLAIAALAGDAVLGGSIGTVVAFAHVLNRAHTGTTPRGRTLVESGAFLLVVAGGAAVGIAGAGAGAVVGTVLSGAAVLLIPVWWSRDVLRESALAQAATERAALQAAQVVRDERVAMARDLHDTVAGHLSAIALQSEAALVAARAQGGDTAVLEGIRAASVASLREMGTMIHLMRSGRPADPAVVAPGLAAVGETVHLARAGGLDLRVAVDDDLGEVAPVTGQAVHRVLQEALTNARKHAGAGPVSVALARDGDDVVLDVASPAPPAPRGPAAGEAAPGAAAVVTGHGLLTMRERAEALGGRFRAGPDEGQRWCVHVRVPARPAAGGSA
ncbi:hypothetical protein GTR02_06665, partial [Kineococcus sp. R8]|uniref:sensor histidine kinase n=1 Tax=Kineococcus siccus TaxID=2696567 RepID=UPI0014135134